VYRRNPLHFILLTSVVHVPWLILQIIFVGSAERPEDVLISLAIGMGTLVTYLLMSGFIIHMASELYLGRPTDAFETFRRVGSRIPRVFIAALIQTLAIGVALAFFLFPAVYVTAVLFAVVPVIVLENKGVSAAFDRSRDLSRGVKWHVLATLGLVILIRLVLQFGAALVATLIPMMAIQHVIAAAVGIVIYPLVGITEALLYYDIRIRKEGFDIEVMASQGAPAPTTAAF
jgi:hypothetical protein